MARLHLQSVVNKNEWDKFVSQYKPDTFMQEWSWGEFNKAEGNEVFRLGLYRGDLLVGVVAGSIVEAKKGKLVYVQHGPCINWEEEEQIELVHQTLVDFGRTSGAWFIRLSPLIIDSIENRGILKDHGYQPASIHPVDAVNTLVVDLTKDEDKLLMDMRKSTRYEIRRADREGVSVKHLSSKEGLDTFYELYVAMVKRQQFIPFEYSRFQHEVEAFSNGNRQKAFFAHYKGRILSSAIVNFSGETAFYNHGASILTNERVSTAHLLQWEIMKYARGKGYKNYNMWGGVAPDDEESHPWQGISRFKEGFGGELVSYVHIHDHPLTMKYYLTKCIETVRKKRMGF